MGVGSYCNTLIMTMYNSHGFDDLFRWMLKYDEVKRISRNDDFSLTKGVAIRPKSEVTKVLHMLQI